ncbi:MULTISPECIES: DoxX family protein [unclassified Methylobacterium]|uniref:DoxX family protein n=1 Tax=unclassified Methylobacterium TaxID=2615210 RepID=UPI000372A63E|nr:MULTISPECIES: DoxX family protein [unclassified Methylobacterium]KQP41936.1 DoxX family protein [Methylobacterium sp. Leaf106]
MFGRSQDGILLASRLLLAAALLPTGIARALNVSGFALALAGAGMPSPNAVATAAVVVQVFGPLALILGVLPRITGFALAGFAVAMAVLLHGFWAYSGAAAMTERTLFLADLGLAGGFLIYAMAGPGACSWQGWRRSTREAPAPARPQSANANAKSAKGPKRSPARPSSRAAA